MSHHGLIETFKHNGRTVKIYIDEDPVNPCKEYDNITTLACWHRRAKLGDRSIESVSSVDLIHDLENSGETVLAILPLFLYEHGGMTMSCGGFSDRFDSGQVGWGYVTQASAEKMSAVGKKIDGTDYDQDWYEHAIKEDVKTYDLYLTGQCYGYVVEGTEGDHLDSCWGFLGELEYVRTEAKRAAEHSEDPSVEREAEALEKRATYAGVES